MFKKSVIISVFCWLVVVLVCLAVLYFFSSDAKNSYQQLMNYSDQAKKERLEDNDGSVQQSRQQVSKQILYKKGSDRLQIFLRGNESELIYSKKNGELVEQFKDLDCIMQDELVKAERTEIAATLQEEIGQQMIRQIKAQEAVYSYKTGKLEAQEMEVAHYLLPGCECPHSTDDCQPLFEGTAYRSQLSLFKEPSMQAQGFQAIFRDWESGK